MTDDLVKRLRYDCELAQQLGDEACVVVQAADVRTILDRIEALTAENERLMEALKIAIVLVAAELPYAPMLPHLRAALRDTQ